jgi:hypothetical protein
MTRNSLRPRTRSSAEIAWLILVDFCISRPFHPMFGTDRAFESSNFFTMPGMIPSPCERVEVHQGVKYIRLPRP